ncbi:MAG: family 16 glycosylhydrolase [Niabella sp.]|nr:family 16 glycosylhydrolase [Niabella sp.]
MLRVLFSVMSCLLASPAIVCAQQKNELQLLGTRSWIRVSWNPVSGADGYRIYWSVNGKKPKTPNATAVAGAGRYYIQDVQPETAYKVWLEPVAGRNVKSVLTGSVSTQKNWVRDGEELKELKTNPSSAAVPKGMQLYWQDEFNDALLNHDKWSTNYFSSLNYFNETSKKEMLENKLPQPAYTLNGKTINLFVNDSLPVRLYAPKGNQKVSSIQTYDWRTNENLLDNSRGGYFEVKVRRSKTGNPKGVNTAFWFDSPGPDLKYYLQQGSEVNGVKGIRPPGQVFEIDVFELLNAQFVLHGQVDQNGKFIHNLATHITKGVEHENNWVTHGMLWTPTGIKHYINGKLMGEYTDKHKIYAPDHFMNVFLGTYGSGGGVNMEVDYIRYYNWPLKNGNELPNPGFEDSGSLLPWEGTAALSADAKKTGNYGVWLQPGQMIEQYVYLNNSTAYKLAYWVKGKGTLQSAVDAVTPVTGELTNITATEAKGQTGFSEKTVHFKTGAAYGSDMKTVHVRFMNTGTAPIMLDDITIKKR